MNMSLNDYKCNLICDDYKECSVCKKQLCIEFPGGCVDVPSHAMDCYICRECFDKLNGAIK